MGEIRSGARSSHCAANNTGFTLKPFGFFDRNPALDLPRSAAARGEHCHGGSQICRRHEAALRPPARLCHMNLLSARKQAVEDTASAAITALYAEHALGLTRLAHVMLDDRATAEDVVHDAFCGLYRHWSNLADPGKAQAYLRSAVLNGSRSVLRRSGHGPVFDIREYRDAPETPDAETVLLAAQTRESVLTALRRLPDRQREALVLRYYLDLADSEIAAVMSVGESTVRSTVHRGLASLGRILSKELS